MLFAILYNYNQSLGQFILFCFVSWNDARRFILFSFQISKLKSGTCLVSVTGIHSLRRIKRHGITIFTDPYLSDILLTDQFILICCFCCFLLHVFDCICIDLHNYVCFVLKSHELEFSFQFTV